MYSLENATYNTIQSWVYDASGQPGRTYYNAGEAYEGQYKRHVRFCGRNTPTWLEGVNGLTATQDPSEEQALS
jgi:hypothetical protein